MRYAQDFQLHHMPESVLHNRVDSNGDGVVQFQACDGAGSLGHISFNTA